MEHGDPATTDNREIPATEWRVSPDFGGKDAMEWRNH